MYLVFHRLWTRFIFKYGSWFLLIFLLVPMLPIHTIFGDSDTSSKGVSYNLGLSWEALSAASFDWLIHWYTDSVLFKTKEKKAQGDLSFSANDRTIFYPTPAVSGVHFLLSGWGYQNFVRRIALLGGSWSLDWIGGCMTFCGFGWRWLLTAGQTFVTFLWAVEGSEVPQITLLEYSQVRSTPSYLFGWMKDFLLVCFTWKCLTLTPAH